MDILTEHGFDSLKYVVGSLCKRKHDFLETGKSLRRLSKGRYASTCVECERLASAQSAKQRHSFTPLLPEHELIALQIHSLDPDTFTIARLCKKEHNFMGLGRSLRYTKKGGQGKYAGRPGDCVKCISTHQVNWRQENYERYKESNKQYYAKTREKQLANAKKYYRQNSDVIKQRAKDWDAAHPDRVKAMSRLGYARRNAANPVREKAKRKIAREKRKAKSKLYYQSLYAANPQVFSERGRRYRSTKEGRLSHLASEHRRRSRKASNHSVHYSHKELIQRFSEFESKCAFCNNCITEETKSLDHFIPISRGGSDAISNLVFTCKTCNTSKKDSDPYEWYLRQIFFSKRQWQKILKILGKTQANYQQIPFL